MLVFMTKRESHNHRTPYLRKDAEPLRMLD